MEAIGAAERLLELFETPLPDSDVTQRTSLPTAKAYRIVCEGLDFAYAEREPTLRDLHLSLEAGTVTALVGASGAGKSTVLKLLLGLIQAQRGRILVNGMDLAQIDPDSWLAQVAWVPQRAHIFTGTVRDNIVLARADASEAQWRAAAVAAGVDEFAAMLPQGYDTPLGERGAGLSGGQIQRIGLARAFLKDAPVLLLDEPSANLDAHNQAAIHRALTRLAEGRTVLLVAHRLASTRLASRVVVLDGGRIVEDGAPAQLLAAQGLYARLSAAAGGA
jgi:ATP-binding cassette, subfamily C, bacterial CydD